MLRLIIICNVIAMSLSLLVNIIASLARLLGRLPIFAVGPHAMKLGLVPGEALFLLLQRHALIAMAKTLSAKAPVRDVDLFRREPELVALRRCLHALRMLDGKGVSFLHLNLHRCLFHQRLACGDIIAGYPRGLNVRVCLRNRGKVALHRHVIDFAVTHHCSPLAPASAGNPYCPRRTPARPDVRTFGASGVDPMRAASGVLSRTMLLNRLISLFVLRSETSFAAMPSAGTPIVCPTAWPRPALNAPETMPDGASLPSRRAALPLFVPLTMSSICAFSASEKPRSFLGELRMFLTCCRLALSMFDPDPVLAACNSAFVLAPSMASARLAPA